MLLTEVSLHKFVYFNCYLNISRYGNLYSFISFLLIKMKYMCDARRESVNRQLVNVTFHLRVRYDCSFIKSVVESSLGELEREKVYYFLWDSFHGLHYWRSLSWSVIVISSNYDKLRLNTVRSASVIKRLDVINLCSRRYSTSRMLSSNNSHVALRYFNPLNSICFQCCCAFTCIYFKVS